MKMVYTQKALSDVDGTIAHALSSFADTKKRVQVACVAVLYHAMRHGDYSKAQILVDGLVGLNQRALVEFFVKFGGLTVDEDSKKFSGWAGKDFIQGKFAESKTTMWWDLKVQNPWEGFDLEKELARVLDKASKAQAKLLKNPDMSNIVHIDAAKLAQLRAIAA